MNLTSKWMLSMAALLLPLQVMAQSVTVGSDSGVGGDVLVIPVTFVAGADIAGIDLDITFDSTQFSSAAASCAANTACPGAFTNCSISPAGTANFILAAGAACVSGTLGEITLTIDNAATAGSKPLSVTVVGLSDTQGTDLDPNVLGVTDGAVTVLGAAYSSNPAPGLLSVGPVIQNAPDPSATVDISNSGAAGTILGGSCTETSDPDGVFSYSNLAFSVLQGDPAHTVTVTCDSAGSIATHTGTMECTHNGDNTGLPSPAVYNLSCTITAGPQPAYASNPAPDSVINMSATNQGDPITPVNVAITNSGDPGTTLTGTCDVIGDAQISVVDQVFSIVQGGPADIQVVSCDSSAEGDYSATLSCPHNGSNASPAEYTVNCSVGPPLPAMFGSNPGDGAVVDMTNGEAVPVGDPAPTSMLQLSNIAAQGALDLAISCSASGDAQISVAPDISGGAAIAAGNFQNVTFSCDTAAPGSFSTTYSCDYIEDGSQTPTGSASFTYTCDVREPMSEVVPDPVSGTELSAMLQPGGSASVMVTFDEIADEGIDGSVDCSLADGTDFVIDTVLPADVPAGGSLVVSVTGTDPETDVDSISDTLNCTYTDTNNSDPGVDVSYPILMSIGGAATNFVTTVTYAGGAVPANPAEVTLTCNSGIPLQQSFSGDVTFVVMDILDGTNCTIVIDGVDSDWVVTGAESDGVPTGDGCVFLADPGVTYTCDIMAVPAPFEFSTFVDWAISAEANGGVGQFATVTQTCLQVWDTVNDTTTDYVGPVTPAYPGATNPIVSPELTPDPFGNTVCSAVFDDGGSGSGLEVVNGCLPGIDVPLGSPSPSCTITATAFYEGIPTLSQYGLALMALLMLGIGMVGFRRYA